MANLTTYPAAFVGDTSVIHSSALNPLGTRAFDTAGNEYIYLQGVASLAAGDWVMYNNATAQGSYKTIRMVNTPIPGMAAVAMAAVVANQFGWFQIFGLTPTYTNIATDATGDGKMLAQSGTAGRATTGPVTTKNLFNATMVGNPASNAGQAFIVYPFCFGSATI